MSQRPNLHAGHTHTVFQFSAVWVLEPCCPPPMVTDHPPTDSVCSMSSKMQTGPGLWHTLPRSAHSLQFTLSSPLMLTAAPVPGDSAGLFLTKTTQDPCTQVASPSKPLLGNQKQQTCLQHLPEGQREPSDHLVELSSPGEDREDTKHKIILLKNMKPFAYNRNLVSATRPPCTYLKSPTMYILENIVQYHSFTYYSTYSSSVAIELRMCKMTEFRT